MYSKSFEHGDRIMKLRKLISLTLILCLVASVTLVFASCDKTKDDGKYTVGICQLVQHPALDSATEGFQELLKFRNASEDFKKFFQHKNLINYKKIAAMKPPGWTFRRKLPANPLPGLVELQ